MKINSLFFLMLTIWACEDAQPMLAKDKYVDIIVDLQIAETMVNNSKVINKDSLRQALQNRICSIYEMKDIATMHQMLAPLEHKPELLAEITKSVTQKLDALADSAITNPE